MFLHEALAWLGEMDFKIHLHGAGWERHPTLGRFARPALESDAAADAVARASKINLQISTGGACEGPIIRGIEAGANYLIRYCPADVIERIYEPLWRFCTDQQITSDAALRERATPGIRRLLHYAGHTLGGDVWMLHENFVGELAARAQSKFDESAIMTWPAEYPAISFASRDELIGLVSRYLYDEPERRRLAEAMRRRVLAPIMRVSVSRRRLKLIPRPVPVKKIPDDVAA
jgi:hypothetical protein